MRKIYTACIADANADNKIFSHYSEQNKSLNFSKVKLTTIVYFEKATMRRKWWMKNSLKSKKIL